MSGRAALARALEGRVAAEKGGRSIEFGIDEADRLRLDDIFVGKRLADDQVLQAFRTRNVRGRCRFAQQLANVLFDIEGQFALAGLRQVDAVRTPEADLLPVDVGAGQDELSPFIDEAVPDVDERPPTFSTSSR